MHLLTGRPAAPASDVQQQAGLRLAGRAASRSRHATFSTTAAAKPRSGWCPCRTSATRLASSSRTREMPEPPPPRETWCRMPIDTDRIGLRVVMRDRANQSPYPPASVSGCMQDPRGWGTRRFRVGCTPPRTPYATWSSFLPADKRSKLRDSREIRFGHGQGSSNSVRVLRPAVPARSTAALQMGS